MPDIRKDISTYSSKGSAGGAPVGRSCFLGIAIDQYAHVGKLNNAVRDMEAVRDLLIAEYDVEKKNCRTLRNGEATRKNVLRALRDMDTWVDPDDKLIIYYSGHGHLNRHKRGFWVPVDADRGAEEDFVSNAVLREILADVPARHILLISDACFSGALFVRGADRADAANDELEIRPSRWALCSGRHDQLVADGEPGKHSPFAASILAELRGNRHEALRIGTLADRVIELTRANYDQLPEGNPLQGVGHQGGQYVFRRRVDEAVIWAETQRQGTPEAYRAYLAAFPQGAHALEAQATLHILAARTEWVAIQAMPHEKPLEITAKRQRIRDFCRNHPDSPSYDAALALGQDMEYKGELLRAWDSEFALMGFIRKDTPYRAAAQRRLDELAPLVVTPPAPEPAHTPISPVASLTPKLQPTPQTAPSRPKASPPVLDTSPPWWQQPLWRNAAAALLLLLIGWVGWRSCTPTSVESPPVVKQDDAVSQDSSTAVLDTALLIIPKPAPKGIPDGKYMVLAGSFTQRKNADALATRLHEMGYSSAAVALFNRGAAATVVVARFYNIADAQRLTGQLNEAGVDAFVKEEKEPLTEPQKEKTAQPDRKITTTDLPKPKPDQLNANTETSSSSANQQNVQTELTDARRLKRQEFWSRILFGEDNPEQGRPSPTPDIASFAANMVRVSGGTFTMGCKNGRDTDCDGNEKPSHEVTLSTFHISKYEVTQAQWRAVMGSDPAELHNKGCDQCPVEGISWNDIQDFLRKLNAQTDQNYRLPTEAEWEYAARGGQAGKANNYKYSGSNNIGEVAWYSGNAEKYNTHGSQKTTHPVGGKKANELGLYDMSGNVWEWCWDWDGSYLTGAQNNPQGADKGTNRVHRGGGWDGAPWVCRAARRGSYTPTSRYSRLGFRLARS